MKKIIKLSILSTVLLSTSLLATVKTVETVEETVNTVRSNKEEFTSDGFNYWLMPKDFFGDWPIPARRVGNANYYWDNEDTPEIVQPNVDAYRGHIWYGFDGEHFAYGDMQRYQSASEKYKNYDYVLKNDDFYETELAPQIQSPSPSDHLPEDFEVIERTPKRGIVPWWEYTHQFNTYLIDQHNSGITDIPELGWEDVYIDYIIDYTTNTPTRNPIEYQYLSNTSLINELFELDNPYYKLPEGWVVTEFDDLTNALVYIDPNILAIDFWKYVADFAVWYWNKRVDEGDEWVRGYEKIDSSWIGWVDFVVDGKDIDIYDETDPDYGVLSSTYVNDPSIKEIRINEARNSTGDNMGNVYNYSFEGFEGPDDIYIAGSLANWGGTGDASGSRYETFYHSDGTRGAITMSMHNPMQMYLVDNVSPIDISGKVTTDEFNQFIIDNQIVQETTLSEFKELFEYNLINNDTWLNEEFLSMFTNIERYEQGHDRLGHNRLQTGTYFIEDIRLSDLVITYSDSDNPTRTISDSMLLKDISNLSIDISLSEDAMFATSTTDNVIELDTSTLESTGTTPLVPEDEGGNIALIIGITVGVILTVGILLAVLMVLKKKKE